MHMADALISPAVGGVMFAATVGVAAFSIKKIKDEMDDRKIPLMGVMGAFVFATQMINFSIPGTGSSGHLGGGILLAILLGPYAGFLTMSSILLIQALFFADGGLLAYGCNVFNLGFYTCFIAYPFIYKLIIKKGYSKKRIFIASVVSSIIGLQLGALSVVIETILSGRTELPFGTFALLMTLIHLAIGLVEGVVTATVVSFLWKARPDILQSSQSVKMQTNSPTKNIIIAFTILFITIGGIFSWFASSDPDGLEWSIDKSVSKSEEKEPEGIYKVFSEFQNKIAFLPDYSFKQIDSETKVEPANNATSKWPDVNAGTSVSGVVGGLMTLIVAIFTGFMIRFFKMRNRKADVR